MAKSSRKTDASKEAAGVGHNSTLPPDHRLALSRIYLRGARELRERERLLKVDKRDHDKRVIAGLGKLGPLQIKLTLQSETPEGEAKLKAELAARAEVKAWVAGDDGQLEMFAGQPAPTETQAFLQGKLDGMDNVPFRNPYGPETVDAEDYARGHHYGERIVDKILADEAEAKAQLVKGLGQDNGGDLDEGEGE